jgi:putative colanic acid biosynthesis UDP-glucose lipid carrier transferase
MFMFDALRQMLDLTLVVLGALIAYALVPDAQYHMFDSRGMLIALDVALVTLVFPMLDMYQSWRGKSAIRLIGRVLVGWLLVQCIGALIYVAVHHVSNSPHTWVIRWTVITGLLLAASRQVTATVLGSLRSAGFNQKRVVIVGSGLDAARLIERIDAAPRAGYAPVAVFDEAANSARIAAPSPIGSRRLPVLTQWEPLVSLIRQSAVTELWLTGHPSQPHPCERFIAEFKHEFVNIRLLPDLDHFALANLGTVGVLGLPSINLVAAPRSDMRMLRKEVFDRLFALAVLVGLGPVLMVLAIAVKLSSPGPVLFKQKRKGVDGNEFWIYKFRSMRVHVAEPGKIVQASRGDKRITQVGAFMRRTSLDELPQFLNVLKGDMSVVGPRPHAVEHDEQYKNQVLNYMYRYRIKPGITGWAQVNGFRGETERIDLMAGRVACDLYYMINWTFWLDLKIVCMTLLRGFIGTHAY